MRLIDADELVKRFDEATENYKADHDYDIDNDPFSDGIMSAMFSTNLMVSQAPTINAISLDKIKQAREDISEMRKEHNVSVTDCLDVLDNLIESET